ncbi:MAG: 50S ribosomal protein L11 methyltransferase [Gammaproteobacteria bacterium]|nr:50S ribosomal protein L11 methyltransferase [Gammaproteobacteria bacterium]
MDWLKLSLSLPAHGVEAGEQVLWSAGAGSITVRDAGDAPLLEPLPGTTPIWPRCRIEALFPARGADGVRLVRRLQQEIPHAHDWQIMELAERDWQRVWMEDWQPLRFGERLWIYPSHHEPPGEHSHAVRLDPGLAFGSGTHATTALCLEWLEAQPLQRQTVLDYGCGSGVLAIAALVLGAEAAFAVDIDPQALQATLDNASRNGVSERLHVQADTDWHHPAVDAVVANILAEPLIRLAAPLAASHRSGGKLALTGILREQRQQVCDAYAHWYTFAAPTLREDWVLLEGTRNARMV